MTQRKRALLTGVTGQDGSYLAELLLKKGYEVHGIIRRASLFNTGRVDHLYHDPHEKGVPLKLHFGDLTDGSGLRRVLEEVQPDEVYNLGAQSHVKVSFDQPEYTVDVDALGTMRLLEAVRDYVKRTGHGLRFYQAGSSEMFGAAPPPQSETTPFHPRSPYACAKVFSHHQVVNYREAYGLFACNGILFNHECVTAETPVIIRRNGMLDCLPISETMPNEAHVRQRILDFEVWDKGGFVAAKLGTVNWNQPSNDRRVHRVVARCGEVRATADHVLVSDTGAEKPAGETTPGDRLLRTALPDPPARVALSVPWARLLGLLSAEGYVGYESGKYVATFRNNDKRLRDEVASLWEQLTGGSVTESPGESGATGEPTGGLALRANPGMLHHLYDILYTRERQKRVPKLVLNSDAAAWRGFLEGYNAGDGLKAGHGDREFKNFKSSSPVLAAGVWWMASRILDQKLTLNVDFVTRGEDEYAYYSINLGAEGGSSRGRHLLKPAEEVKRVKPEPYTGWLYDIETASGTFHAGVGDLVIHNSPRRGETFVTRKITRAAGRIRMGLQDTLYLGNLDARRDWGFAGDYVEAMWRMLQRDEPDDYVVATGEAYSVREFLHLVFDELGLDVGKHVKVDPRYFRPAEVDFLQGDASKARRDLGWTPRVGLKELARMMVQADLDLAKREKTLKDAGHAVVSSHE